MSRTDTIAAIGHDMARSALAWLAENRTYGGLPDTWSPQDAEPDSAYKPLGETALAASLALREGVGARAECREQGEGGEAEAAGHGWLRRGAGRPGAAPSTGQMAERRRHIFSAV